MKHETLNIPLELVEHSAKTYRIKPLRVYLAMKFVYSGQVRIHDVNWHQIGSIAGFKDVRTVKTHLTTCQDLDWIGSDGQWYIIRSFERVRELTGAISRTAIEATPKQVSEILEFALPAKIQSRARARRHARKTAGAKQTTPEPFTCLDNPELCTPYFDTSVSCSLIGQWYGISASSASRLKARAKKAGYTTYQHRYKKIGTHRANFGAVAESIEAERLTIHDGEVAIRLTDLFRPANYKFSTRASL